MAIGIGAHTLLPHLLSGRALTEGEESQLRAVFKEAIGYKKVKVHTSKVSWTSGSG